MTAPAQNQTDHIVGSQVATSAQAPTATPAVRTAISKVLQAAVDWNLLEQNPARGICIGDRAPKTERLYLNPKEVGRLLASLSEPCRTLVLVAVLTGMRIGEILALRWKAVDLVRGIICVRETVSEGKFGSPKTKSSRRDIPMSQPVREAFQAQLAHCRQRSSDDLVFTTRNQTPLNPKNLLRRVLRPACKALALPLISWHSFRHTHATQLAEVGESLRTAQALLGHSDLETTLNFLRAGLRPARQVWAGRGELLGFQGVSEAYRGRFTPWHCGFTVGLRSV